MRLGRIGDRDIAGVDLRRNDPRRSLDQLRSHWPPPPGSMPSTGATGGHAGGDPLAWNSRRTMSGSRHYSSLEPPPVPTTYSRVTVVNGSRRVDLALPSALPLADVLPQLLSYCAPEPASTQPDAWTLARLGGSGLSLSTTLAEAGITDGDVLELRTSQDGIHPAYVEDVRDALEDAMDETARRWEPATTVAFGLTVSSIGLALAVLLPQVWMPREVGPLITAVLLAGLLGAGAGWADQRGLPRVAQLVLAAAALWGAVAGWLAASWPAWPAPTAAAAAGVAALLVTALVRLATPVATAQLAGLSLVGAAGLVVGAISLAGGDPLVGVRLAAVAAVLVVGVLPRVSLTIGGLASADYRVRNHGLVTSEELTVRIERSNALLSGSLVGAAALGLGGGGLLAASDLVWDHLLGVVVGIALLLRSRVFSRIWQILPLRVAGLAVLVIHAVVAGQAWPPLRPWLVPLAAVLAAGLVAVSAVPLSDVARARVKQLLNRAELVAVVAVVALAAAALGVFVWVDEFTMG